MRRKIILSICAGFVVLTSIGVYFNREKLGIFAETTTQPQFVMPSVIGSIRNYKNDPLSNITLIFSGKGGHYKTTSTSDGSFTISKMLPGVYLVQAFDSRGINLGLNHEYFNFSPPTKTQKLCSVLPYQNPKTKQISEKKVCEKVIPPTRLDLIADYDINY